MIVSNNNVSSFLTYLDSPHKQEEERSRNLLDDIAKIYASRKNPETPSLYVRFEGIERLQSSTMEDSYRRSFALHHRCHSFGSFEELLVGGGRTFVCHESKEEPPSDALGPFKESSEIFLCDDLEAPLESHPLKIIPRPPNPINFFELERKGEQPFQRDLGQIYYFEKRYAGLHPNKKVDVSVQTFDDHPNKKVDVFVQTFDNYDYDDLKTPSNAAGSRKPLFSVLKGELDTRLKNLKLYFHSSIRSDHSVSRTIFAVLCIVLLIFFIRAISVLIRILNREK